MSIKENTIVNQRLCLLSDFAQSPQSKEFDSQEILNYFSTQNKQLLNSTGESFNIYLNLLNSVNRWEHHYYQPVVDSIYGLDNDYLHTLNMEKIKEDFKTKNFFPTINFDLVELEILIHDGGEIITGDISQHHPQKDQLANIKEIEFKAFGPIVLRHLKGQQRDLRYQLKSLYQRYHQRGNNEFDTESHLVKFIDHLEGNKFGLEKVYDQKILDQFYPLGDFPVSPDFIISNMINSEINQLDLVLKSGNNPNFVSYYYQNFFQGYTQHGYSHLTPVFESRLEKLSQPLSTDHSVRQSLPSF